MRRVWIMLILAALAAGGFAGTHWFLQSPRWTLYQIGKAIHERNAPLFIAYVDVGRILGGQKDDIVDLILPDRERTEQRDFLKGLITAFMGTLTDQVNQQIIRVINDPQRDNLPSSWTLALMAQVSVNGDNALALLADPREGRRLRLGLRRDEERRWRVVEINPQDLKVLAQAYLRTKSEEAAPKSVPAPAPVPAPEAAPTPAPAPAPAQ